MGEERSLFLLLDLSGTFIFAISGAVAAKERNLDLFGILAISFVVACGGGIVRDVCIGAIPPAGLANWNYLAAVVAAALTTIVGYRQVRRFRNPVLLFDAIGLGLFAVSGAQKALSYGHNAEVAVLLGVLTAVGGGVVRDVLLVRVPLILQREIYASAALVGAVIQVACERLGVAKPWTPWVAMFICVGLRLMSLRFKWHLPTFGDRSKRKISSDP
ncbi:MAG TPA: trimeric intracellular cation channel family protein [Paraburkholderia sp.]|uniref:trimeric intracellular cation channel family protein n=1 Tax=Paraburkholderia sp. TaxID=1926495 RepID=UPI002B47E945|nr:trimeric intracellular cation channel family protein [Paraburkholderia sp.]HKR46752.1 trimeric intracellular cation channel family protein [Paraburkholderia sp.]